MGYLAFLTTIILFAAGNAYANSFHEIRQRYATAAEPDFNQLSGNTYICSMTDRKGESTAHEFSFKLTDGLRTYKQSYYNDVVLASTGKELISPVLPFQYNDPTFGLQTHLALRVTNKQTLLGEVIRHKTLPLKKDIEIPVTRIGIRDRASLGFPSHYLECARKY